MESCGCTVIGSEAEETVKVLPPMVNEVTTIEWLESEFLNVIKNSAVALTVGLMELTARARAMQEMSFQVFEAFTAAGVVRTIAAIMIMAREATCCRLR